MSLHRNNTIDLLDLPGEIPAEAIPSVIESYGDQTKYMASLSSACKPLYSLFQQELDQRAGQQLLTLVLKPTHANLEKAKKMYRANPRLLFIESTAQEYAAGLDEKLKNVHRVVKASPIRAMAAASDRWLLQEVIKTKEFQQYFDPVSNKSAYALAVDEINKQFPNSFDFPSSTYDFGPLIDAITNDQSLIQHNVPSDVTEALLVQFRKDFLPDKVVSSGHFFNLNELGRAFEIYEENLSSRSSWGGKQQSLFWCKVVGYFESLVTGVVGEVISQGIKNVIDGHPPKRQYDFDNCKLSKRVSFFPLTDDPSIRLGLSFAVDSYYAACAKSGLAPRVRLLTKLISSNSSELRRIYAALVARAKPCTACKP